MAFLDVIADPHQRAYGLIGYLPASLELGLGVPSTADVSYFVYLTCTFSILPLNLNGAFSK
jgi:hypothetical protein